MNKRERLLFGRSLPIPCRYVRPVRASPCKYVRTYGPSMCGRLLHVDGVGGRARRKTAPAATARRIYRWIADTYMHAAANSQMLPDIRRSSQQQQAAHSLATTTTTYIRLSQGDLNWLSFVNDGLNQRVCIKLILCVVVVDLSRSRWCGLDLTCPRWEWMIDSIINKVN